MRDRKDNLTDQLSQPKERRTGVPVEDRMNLQTEELVRQARKSPFHLVKKSHFRILAQCKLQKKHHPTQVRRYQPKLLPVYIKITIGNSYA